MEQTVTLDTSFEEEEKLSEYVTFVIENESFAINMAPVQEIIRVPEMVHVPKSPPSLMGLANLRGSILPIINLRKVFGISSREIDESSRIIVINLGQPLGFLVDRVLSVINVEESAIEDSSQIQSIVKSKFLEGVIKDASTQRMIMMLNMGKIISSEFAETLKEVEKQIQTSKLQKSSQEEEAQAEERQLVSFTVEGEEYAIGIEDIQEIVQIPEHIVKVPNTESSVIGIMNLRDRVLPLTSLRKIFNLEDKPLDERSRIIVLTLDGISVGVVVDSVREVLRVPNSLIEPVSKILFDGEEKAEITEICKLNQGKRLVSIISVPNLFKTKAVKEALSPVETQKTSEDIEQIEENEDEEQVVVFVLNREEYAVAIESVQEIVRVPEELTHIPKTPAFVEGVINLRGNVLPVIDLRKRFEIEGKERDDQQRIMVFVIEGVSVGFIVDSVTEVLKIPKKLIFEAPKLSSEQSKIFPKVANLDKEGRIIQLIEPRELLNKEEIEEIAQSYE
ncbi:chemotaxis protein CheW [Thermodesulfovibrio yellowstonii]|uniref:chemotaxis protein CheW n=1 Tax=Thermodesulfovibrio yellowstonii TaxID=28262 RepID=UPI000415CFC3|nr:chemotaxis protein CheW [Thermodesulfovibrio islandicus]